MAGTEFKVFSGAVASGGLVKGLNARGCASFARREVDELVEVSKTFGAKGLAYFTSRRVACAAPSRNSSRPSSWRRSAPPWMASRATCFSLSPTSRTSPTPLQPPARHLAKQLNLADPAQRRFVWIIDFPMFEWKPEEKRYDFMHNPVSAPHPDDPPLSLREGWKSEAEPGARSILDAHPRESV